jgi:membrane protein
MKVANKLARFWELVSRAGSRWFQDECYRLGAALSYYAVFSLVPLLLICVTVVGFILGDNASTRLSIVQYVQRSGAPELGPLLADTLASMQKHQTARGVGAAVGGLTLVIGASGVFSELESALDRIWPTTTPVSQPLGRRILLAIKGKAMSFLVVAGVALILLLSLLLSTGLSLLARTTGTTYLSWMVAETLVSLVVLTVFIAAIFHLVPKKPVPWTDAWRGAFVTSALFVGLKRLLAWYLTYLGNYAAYGAVGEFLSLLVWIYVVSDIFLFGAEFCRVDSEARDRVRRSKSSDDA